MSLASMFLLGLLGSAHCVGMCGGIALSLSQGGNSSKALHHQLLYNLSRGLLYGLIGGVIASFGWHVESSLPQWGKALMFAGVSAALFYWGIQMILQKPLPNLLGNGKLLLKMGALSKKYPALRPVLFGGFSGFLPCGLLYIAYARVFIAPGFVQGFLGMVAFWLGTVPALLGLGWLYPKVFTKATHWNLIAGAFILITAVVTAQHGWSVAQGGSCH